MYSQVSTPESELLKKAFSAYYENNYIDSVIAPQSREFGYGVFRKKIANRNLSFRSSDEINYFLRNSKPLFFSYSNAYYKFPDRTPMQAKELFKADIIYEFDADELGLEVLEVNGIQWFNKEHLEEAKKQVFRLLDFIQTDFNFSSQGLAINFSGKAGFHVHLRGEEILGLNKRARIELVDYLTAQGMDYVNLGFDLDSLLAPKPIGLWQKRIFSAITKFFEKDSKEISKITGLTNKKTLLLLSNKSALLNSLQKGVLMQVDGRKSKEFWKNVLDYVTKIERAPIDRQTSIDLNKIIRVPMTLHGDTGLVAKILTVDELKSFNPFNDAVVFDEKFASVFGQKTIKVLINNAPKFSINGQEFGPFENSVEELPLFAAIYLIGKGAATIK